MMTKKEFISQLTIFAGRYADERLGDNNKLFASNQHLREDMLEWEQKYHSAMAANKRLDEQNENLSGEVSQWKKDNSALNALNKTLSEKLQEEKELRANQYQDFLKQEQSSQNWQANYYAMQRLKDSLAKELDALMVKLEEAEETIKDRQERYDEAYKVGNKWFEESKELTIHCKLLQEELAAAEERQEDFKKKSHGILATLEENLQKKQETIEALTGWKEETESVLVTLEASVKQKQDKIDSLTSNNEILAKTAYNLQAQLEALKQINSFQEHRIEVLSRKANKMRKKEQND